MMLDHVGLHDKATRMRAAIDKVLREDNVRTGDLGGKATTREFSAAIVRRLA
jgi:isocitrate dehydrogenase (NAD+)